MVQSKLGAALKTGPKLQYRFFKQASGTEPVRDWLKQLSPESDRKIIGTDICAVQFAWPLGLPLVDYLEDGIWEVRSRLANRIARVLFVVENDTMILLHGFIKKEKRTPDAEKKVARDRLKKLRGIK